MRIERDKLVFLALATCAEQVELARTGAPPLSHGVRLALAVLHSFGSGGREPFDNFWLQLIEDRTPIGGMADYSRATHLQAQLRGVMRAVGIEPSNATEDPLHQAALRVYPRGRLQGSTA